MAHHYSLRYMNYDVVDENLLLAKQLIENTKPVEETKLLLKRAKKEYEEAKRLINQGEKAEAIAHIVNSYNHGIKAWDLQKK